MKSKSKDENIFGSSSLKEMSTQPKLCGIVNPIRREETISLEKEKPFKYLAKAKINRKEKNSNKKDHDQSLLEVEIPNKKREAKVSADNESKIASKKIKGLDWFLQEKKASAASANKSSVNIETLDNVSFVTLECWCPLKGHISMQLQVF